jgi:proteic killer suppression protein
LRSVLLLSSDADREDGIYTLYVTRFEELQRRREEPRSARARRHRGRAIRCGRPGNSWPVYGCVRLAADGHSLRSASRLIEDDDGRELRHDLVRRLRNILAVLIAAADIGGVVGPPSRRVHRLRGDPAGSWSISVSGNWRLTFDIRQGEIGNLDLEDYHSRAAHPPE